MKELDAIVRKAVQSEFDRADEIEQELGSPGLITATPTVNGITEAVINALTVYPRFAELTTLNLFKAAVERQFGIYVREDDDIAEKLWASMANTKWHHEVGEAALSFREAGAFIADLRGAGDYIDWYCCRNYPYRGADILEPMAAEGWTAKDWEE